ncbi:MAG: DNA polymerase III subunit delta [Arenicellales bacterium]
MRLSPEDLTQRLASGPPRTILLFGEEPLLIEENAQRVRDSARERGFTDRIPLSADTGFDWGKLTGSGRTLSLFSERRLIELRLPTGKPGDAGTRAITELGTGTDDDVCLLVITGHLDGRAKRAEWVKALDAGGWVVEHRALTALQFPAWFRRRLRDRGLVLDRENIDSLCHFLEGNLLAAAQEIDRLVLFADGDGRVNPEAVSRGLVDHARFNAYAFVDACLAGDMQKALRVLAVLHNEGTEPVLVIWSLAKDVRVLVRIEHGLRNGGRKGALFKSHNVWSNRAPLVNAALARLGETELERAIRQLARCDRVLKGREEGGVWHELEVAALMICDPRYTTAGAMPFNATS